MPLSAPKLLDVETREVSASVKDLGVLKTHEKEEKKRGCVLPTLLSMGTSSSGGARRPQMGGRREPAVNVKGWRGGQSPAPATGYFFSWRERRRSPSQKGEGERAPGRRPWLLDRRGSSVRRHIHAPPHFRLGAFSVQMLQPRCRHPPGTPEAEGDSRACRGMAGGAGGLWAVSGGSLGRGREGSGSRCR